MLEHLIKLTPLRTVKVGEKETTGVLELDCRRVVGWMSVSPTASLVYTDLPNENRVFSVTESIEEIKKLYRESIDSPNDVVDELKSMLDMLPDDDEEEEWEEMEKMEKSKDVDSPG